jgi:hypothetical protein
MSLRSTTAHGSIQHWDTHPRNNLNSNSETSDWSHKLRACHTTLRDSVLAVLVVAGTVFGLLSGALATIVYIALKFTHKSVTPEAVKDIFLLGVQKGAEGLVDVSKRLPFPYEIDDKLAGAIASGVGRYLSEIGFTPPTTHTDPPPESVLLEG